MKTKIAVKTVKDLRSPAQGEQFIWDEELACFGIKLTATRMTYIVQCRVNGKTVKHVVGKVGEMHPADARLKAAKALSELRSGINLNKEKSVKKVKALKLAEAYEKFKDARKFRPKTIEIYDAAINNYLGDWLDKPVINISKDMIQQRHKELSDPTKRAAIWKRCDDLKPDTKKSKGRPRSDEGQTLANQVMRTLRVTLNYAGLTNEDEDGKSILPENPVKRLSQTRSWNTEKRRQDVILDHQLKSWCQSVQKLDNPVLRDYLLFVLFTGLRKNEALQLEWDDLDTEGKTLTIPRERTKNKETHQLPLSDYLCDLLTERHQHRVVGNKYVFPGVQPGTHAVEPKRAIKAVVDKSGVKFFSHTLRRTFISTGERLDVSYLALKALLNHKSKSDVTASYVVTETERLREPMQKIADHLMKHMGITIVQEVGVELSAKDNPAAQ
jgi:integrase